MNKNSPERGFSCQPRWMIQKERAWYERTILKSVESRIFKDIPILVGKFCILSTVLMWVIVIYVFFWAKPG
jgi:hypothetical protein